MLFFRKKKRAAYDGPYCACVVAAAGSSRRMGGADKLMAPLGGQPVLLRTLRALNDSPCVQEILVVTRSELLVTVGDLCQENGLGKVTQVLLGGETRLESVYKGVNQVSKKAKLIAVHDGARPLVSQAVIAAAVEGARRFPAAAPAVPVKDTVKSVEGDLVTGTPDRATLRLIQTPQVFDADLLKAALQKAVDDGAALTDDCAAVERLGAAVVLTQGEERNLKITTPADLAVAEALLALDPPETAREV